MELPVSTSLAPESPAAAALPAVVRAIAEALNPQAIIVFGSVARGTAGPNSDLDLLIIDDFAAAGRTKSASIGLLYKAIWGVDVSIDPLVISPAEFERWRGSPHNVIGTCAREGRVVHGHT